MKKFAKKSLAIAVIMMAFGGMANMAHAKPPVASKDIRGDREVKVGSNLEVVFEATPNEIIAGALTADAPVFHLVARDAAPHGSWGVLPTGESSGGVMVTADGKKVKLTATKSRWRSGGIVTGPEMWLLETKGDLDETFYLAKGLTVEPGQYHFTAKVEEYEN
ncbi:MyfA/PsaA family fimbrial adhesin [Yersinia enterocolitica]|uniref:MyfA/PsaA family fimbrial adhesin n=1 Tax=Yersinia enterocolitica TaxID=630 RepID=UPI0005E0258B|nr:MyfA/PsaA family fimbrial adhesin [Yersinia enterocolitica]EKN3752989.1 MyfA/PsaA family fimbrial adhesin [Yersinia enterocolitica]EKN3794221.1 MyfA/PsaA family fimbrial adhesin [Yersinia enterocolitica]EKN3875153.1 MyfA/PsaA family fimbrial adhesin [Yersinia enterocolitica]EKN4042682.1 MyfA/PsaA family fimbrial adhesin [Yersinia enterocolitica]EKN4172717.1 MyfA/PsaA family fimbrial adhesin [Yersinia enterocolitica]